MKLSNFFIYAFVLLFITTIITFLSFNEPLFISFINNNIFSSLIITTLFCCIVHTLYRTISLQKNFKWFDVYIKNDTNLKNKKIPSLIKPLIKILNNNKISPYFIPSVVHLEISNIKIKLQESHNITIYLINLLLYFTVFGLCYGIFHTVNISNIFNDISNIILLKSYFNLFFISILCYISLYFIDKLIKTKENLFCIKVQDTFYTPNLSKTNQYNKPYENKSIAYILAMLTKISENIEDFQNNIIKSEQNRMEVNNNLTVLCKQLAKVNDQRSIENSLLMKIAQAQLDFQTLIKDFYKKINENQFGIDIKTKEHIRNLDVTINRLLELTLSSQSMLSKELKDEMRLLSHTISNIINEDAA